MQTNTQNKLNKTDKQGLLFCGDVVAMKKRFTCTKELQELLSSYESFCNLEAPICPESMQNLIRGGAAIKKPIDKPIKAGPALHTHEKSIDDLAQAGFNGFMLANNHIGDYGEMGLESSCKSIQQADLKYIGAGCKAYPDPKVLYYTINETKVAILNGAESQFGMLDSMSAFLGSNYGYRDCFGYEFLSHIQEVRKSVDVVICVIHAGLENALYPLPQFRELYRFYCDMGADCIIAHHPHIIQGYEDYITKDKRNARIFYSLGNLYFSLNEPSSDPLESQGLGVIMSFAKGEIADYKLFYTEQGEDDCVGVLDSSKLYHSMESLCAPLYDEKLYKEKILEIITQYYPQYMRYYEWAFLLPSQNNSFITNCKLFIKSLFFPHRNLAPRQALFLHNINIPTHRFVQELYLKHRLYHSTAKA